MHERSLCLDTDSFHVICVCATFCMVYFHRATLNVWHMFNMYLCKRVHSLCPNTTLYLRNNLGAVPSSVVGSLRMVHYTVILEHKYRAMACLAVTQTPPKGARLPCGKSSPKYFFRCDSGIRMQLGHRSEYVVPQQEEELGQS